MTAESCVAARVKGAGDLAQSAARIGCQSSEDGPHSVGQFGCALSGQFSHRGPWGQTGQSTPASHSENTLSLLAVGVDGEQGVLQHLNVEAGPDHKVSARMKWGGASVHWE